MAEDRIVTTEPGKEGSHTTIIHDHASRGGGAGWLIAIILLVAVIGGFYLFNRTSASEATRNNAIANAADNIGNAASQVGNAAQKAADSATR